MSVGAGTSTAAAAAQGYQAYDVAANGALAKVEPWLGITLDRHNFPTFQHFTRARCHSFL